MIDFIGLGAQKAGTSWVYACLYEHPEICAPVKELHFFSRSRFERGRGWYESYFKRCGEGKLKGEFSTSYLYSEETPHRIKAMYPDAKLIAILRNPVDRAFSQYRNAIKAGEIPESVSFDGYKGKEKSVLEQGLYATQLKRYMGQFPRDQLLVLVYEDITKDPKSFMKRIYAFLGVDTDFEASMLYKRINIARLPKSTKSEKYMHTVAEFLRRHGFDKMVHWVRRSGLPDMVRTINTKKAPGHLALSEAERRECTNFFREDVQELGALLERDLSLEWGI